MVQLRCHCLRRRFAQWVWSTFARPVAPKKHIWAVWTVTILIVSLSIIRPPLAWQKSGVNPRRWRHHASSGIRLSAAVSFSLLHLCNLGELRIARGCPHRRDLAEAEMAAAGPGNRTQSGLSDVTAQVQPRIGEKTVASLLVDELKEVNCHAAELGRLSYLAEVVKTS